MYTLTSTHTRTHTHVHDDICSIATRWEVETEVHKFLGWYS